MKIMVLVIWVILHTKKMETSIHHERKLENQDRSQKKSQNTATSKGYVDALKKSIHNASNNMIRDKEQ